MYPSEAANKVGIHYSTLKGWLTKGYDYQALRLDGAKLAAPEKAFADFYVAFYKEEGAHVESLLEQIETIGTRDGQWTALMTILERRYPERWKKREQTEVVGVGGGELKIQVDNSPRALLEVVKVLHESGALPGLLASFTGNPDPARAIIDAEAHEIHPSHSDSEAEGGVTP